MRFVAGELSNLLNTDNFIFRIIIALYSRSFFEIYEKRTTVRSPVTLQCFRGNMKLLYLAIDGLFVEGQRVSEITFARGLYYRLYFFDSSAQVLSPRWKPKAFSSSQVTFPITLVASHCECTLCRSVLVYTRGIFRASGRNQRERDEREFISANDRIAPGRKDPAKFDYTLEIPPLLPPASVNKSRNALCVREYTRNKRNFAVCRANEWEFQLFTDALDNAVATPFVLKRFNVRWIKARSLSFFRRRPFFFVPHLLTPRGNTYAPRVRRRLILRFADFALSRPIPGISIKRD